jgi:hypothetical protein
MKAIFWIGKCGLFGTLIRAFKRRGVSHAEIMFSDGVSGTAQPRGGVVLRKIDFKPEDWFVLDLPCTPIQEEVVRAFFEKELGCPYDWSGIVFAQVLGWNWQSKEKYFCSEVCTAALKEIYKQLADVKPWRCDPAKELILLEERVMPPPAPVAPTA